MALAPDTAAILVQEIFALQRAVRCLTGSALRGERMGFAPYLVLRLVGEGECRATRLAARLRIGAPVLSRHLAELEMQGLVVRRKDPDDGRAQLVAITDRGVEALGRLDSQRSSAFQDHLCSWDEEDAVRAAKTLRQLAQSLINPAHAAQGASTETQNENPSPRPLNLVLDPSPTGPDA